LSLFTSVIIQTGCHFLSMVVAISQNLLRNCTQLCANKNEPRSTDESNCKKLCRNREGDDNDIHPSSCTIMIRSKKVKNSQQFHQRSESAHSATSSHLFSWRFRDSLVLYLISVEGLRVVPFRMIHNLYITGQIPRPSQQEECQACNPTVWYFSGSHGCCITWLHCDRCR
jgi:hypothetical protein